MLSCHCKKPTPLAVEPCNPCGLHELLPLIATVSVCVITCVEASIFLFIFLGELLGSPARKQAAVAAHLIDQDKNKCEKRRAELKLQATEAFNRKEYLIAGELYTCVSHSAAS